MPPRYSYWTILAGGLPTAFRATDRSELEPTFNRLREKHPDAVMKWFARGRLWESPEQARAAVHRDAAPPGSRRPPFQKDREARGRDWRPGGDHRDPRQKFKDARKARNQERRQLKFERKHQGDARPAPREKPHGDKLRPGTRHPSDRGRFAGGTAPAGPRPSPDRRPEWRPDGETWRGRPPRGKWSDRGPRQNRDTHHGRAGTEREFRPDKAPAMRKRDDWRDRPPREKPHGNPLARGRRPLDRRTFPRGQQVEPQPPRPPRPPRPSESPKPTPPPRPSEPAVPPPGPPERGRRDKPKRRRG